MFDGENFYLKNFYNQSFSNVNYEFRILKLYEEIGEIDSYQLKIIEDEPIDLFIKYIDLRDKNLNRNGIKQIYIYLGLEKYSLSCQMRKLNFLNLIKK